MELTRRAMLGALGGLAVGGTVASVVGTSIAADPKTKRFEQINGDFGWKPHKLDPKECAAVAYDGYWHKGLGCAYGAFYAIVGLMGEKYGAPYNQFPFAMLEVGKGGIFLLPVTIAIGKPPYQLEQCTYNPKDNKVENIIVYFAHSRLYRIRNSAKG